MFVNKLSYFGKSDGGEKIYLDPTKVTGLVANEPEDDIPSTYTVHVLGRIEGVRFCQEDISQDFRSMLETLRTKEEATIGNRT